MSENVWSRHLDEVEEKIRLETNKKNRIQDLERLYDENEEDITRCLKNARMLPPQKEFWLKLAKEREEILRDIDRLLAKEGEE